MVVEGVCLPVVLIGRLGRHGAGLFGMLNEVPALILINYKAMRMFYAAVQKAAITRAYLFFCSLY